MKRNVNWRAVQATGCLKPDSFKAPGDLKPRHMAGGSWRANLHKEGKLHVPHHGRA